MMRVEWAFSIIRQFIFFTIRFLRRALKKFDAIQEFNMYFIVLIPIKSGKITHSFFVMLYALISVLNYWSNLSGFFR
jgi:hypothetical protein